MTEMNLTSTAIKLLRQIADHDAGEGVVFKLRPLPAPPHQPHLQRPHVLAARQPGTHRRRRRRSRHARQGHPGRQGLARGQHEALDHRMTPADPLPAPNRQGAPRTVPAPTTKERP